MLRQHLDRFGQKHIRVLLERIGQVEALIYDRRPIVLTYPTKKEHTAPRHLSKSPKSIACTVDIGMGGFERATT